MMNTLSGMILFLPTLRWWSSTTTVAVYSDLIDGPRQQPERELLFTTPVKRSIKEVAEHYKLCYSSAANESELSKALQNTTSSRPRIIEVKTNPDSDVDLFTSFKNLSIL
jgi:2-succinyl-5-enolpyruvyl-6-hydroxy-3-cyclohexene-1-carboxylate synthase